MAYNFPDAPTNGDIVQTAGQRFGWVSALARWEYQGAAQFNNGFGAVVPGINTWVDADTTLTATGCVQLSLDNATWGATIAVINGGTFYTRWEPGVTCDGAPHGTTITGTITDNTSGASQTYTKTIDYVPDAFTLSNASQTVTPVTLTGSACFTVSGTNADPYLWGTLTGGTTAQYNVNGGAYSSLPSAPGTVAVTEGDTVCVRFTTSATLGNTDTLQVSVGQDVVNSVSGTMFVLVAKSAFSGTVNTPTIAYPITACFTWDSGADTIYATGCLEFNVNGGAYGQGTQVVADGNTVCTRWKDGTGPGTTCSDATHGTVLDGTIESVTRAKTVSLTLDKQPDSFNFTDQNNFALSSVATSNTITLSGTNAIAYLQWTPDATNPLTSVQASINGGAFVTVPAAGTYTLEVPVGATVQVKGTTGAANTTDYKGTFTIGDSAGNTTDTWMVTTVSTAPAIQTPSITSPVSGSTKVGTTSGVTIIADTYTPLNGAGAVQTSSTWEVYKGGYPLTSTGTITTPTLTTLTVPGASTDGFAVGMQIKGDTSGAIGIISSISGDVITYTGISGTFATGETVSVDSSTYTAVTGSPFTVSSAPFTQLTVAFAALSTYTKYHARVKYATTNATAATSSYSAWSNFTTGSLGPSVIGEAYGGGYFGGYISTTGNGVADYALIVAPKATGQSATQLRYKTLASADTNPNSQNLVYGGLATDQFNDLAHPAFQYASSLIISGYTDWYVPSRYELEILYYNLKPDALANNTTTGAGINPYAVPPRASDYTAAVPTTTSSTLFQSGGSEAFDSGRYWSSSQVSTTTTFAYAHDFSSGILLVVGKNGLSDVRAIRRVAL